MLAYEATQLRSHNASPDNHSSHDQHMLMLPRFYLGRTLPQVTQQFICQQESSAGKQHMH